MEENKGSGNGASLTFLALLGVVMAVAVVYGSIWINDTADAINKYEWAHGYTTGVKAGAEHCEKWVEKHWKGTKEQYKYHCQWLYKWDNYDEECSYKDFKRWYKYAYNSYGELKRPGKTVSCAEWLRKNKR